MAAPDTTAIDTTIDQIVYTDTTANGKKPNAESLRNAYKAVTKWAKEQIQNAMPWRRVADGKGSVDETDVIYHMGMTVIGGSQVDPQGGALQAASFSTPVASIRRLNGLVLNRAITISPINMPAGSGDYRYLKIAQLNAENAGLYDILGVRLVMGSWGSLPRGVIDATFGNRAGLRCTWNQWDDLASCGLVAYQSTPAGITTIYVKYINGFRSGSLSINHNVQATVFDDWVEEVPAGTLVFDSFNPAAYPPTLQIDQNAMAVRGFVRTGAGNVGFQVTNVKPGSNLSINTGQYLELKLDTGATLKVALLN